MAAAAADGKFEFPEYYSLPPFFTIQPVEATRKKQFDMWHELIGLYLRHAGKSVVNTDKDRGLPPFRNETIDRGLGKEDLITILDSLVAKGCGQWLDAERTACAVSWKTFQEWARSLYEWAAANGQLGSVCTVYELRAGDETRDADFHGLDEVVIMAALECLEAQGHAALIRGETLDDTGVKFLPR